MKKQIRADRNKALVTRDLDGKKIKQFESDYEKLMADPDEEKLEEKYAGKKRLNSQPSLNSLARIKATHEGSELGGAEIERPSL